MIVSINVSRQMTRRSRALLALFVVTVAPLSLAGQSGERDQHAAQKRPAIVAGRTDESLEKTNGPEKTEAAVNDEKQATSRDDLIMEFSSAEHLWQQEAIARELIALRDAKIIPTMEKHLATKDRRRRCNAAWVMAGLGDKRGLAVIIAELEDKSMRPTDMIRSDGEPYPEGQITADRYYAAVLLGRLGMKEAVPVLIKALGDETIHYAAAISLGEIGDKSAIPALRQMLTTFPDQRLWAGYGLAALSEPNGFRILTDVINSDPNWTDRRHAVEALGKFKQPQTLPVIEKALQDSHVNVRVSAARALGAMQDPAAIPALTAALNDKEVTKIHAPTTVETEARKAIKLIKEKGR